MEASNSFPSNLNPIFQDCDNQLRRLVQISNTTTTTSSTFSEILSHKLRGLEDLYESVETLLQEPLAQRAFVRLGHGDGWTDQVLDGSLRQLDACSAAKDAILHTKERAREVQSVTRRRRGADRFGLESELVKYFASRKVVKKAAQKALKNLKSGDATKGSFSSSQDSDNQDSEITMMELVGVLREVELVTLGVFESLLCFVCGTKTQSAKWYFVSKFCRSKRVGCEVDEKVVNEFENVDEIVHTLMCCETRNKCDHSLDCVENVKTQLQNLESCVQDFEERLERLFRRLIRTRVSLLNILNN